MSALGFVVEQLHEVVSYKKLRFSCQLLGGRRKVTNEDENERNISLVYMCNPIRFQ